MTNHRKIGVAIPSYNRVEVLLESFSEILTDPRIKNIHISDDCSDIEIYNKVNNSISLLNQFANGKITMSRNTENQDCFRNKKIAVEGSVCDWLILADSDNIFRCDYLDRLYEIDWWDTDTIYTPSYAMPQFDFTDYSGLVITKENVAEYLDKPLFETMLNANNFFVNRAHYLKVRADDEVDPVTSDSIYFCMKWLQDGRKIKVVTGLQYFHRIWEQSHYRTQNHRTPPGFHQSVLDKLKQLK